MKALFLVVILATVLCELDSEEGTVFREQRSLYQIPTGEEYSIKTPLGSKFSIDLPSVIHEPAMWQLKHMENLCGLHCTVKTVPILYTIAAQQDLDTKLEAARPEIAYHPARRVFTCWATKLTKTKLKFYYKMPMIEVAGKDHQTIFYTVNVKVVPCKHPYH